MEQSREIKQLREHFADGPSHFPSSPLYQSLCAVVAQDQPTLELLTQRRPGPQASFLLFGAVRYLLLSGVEHPLRNFFLPVNHDLAADSRQAGPLLLDFCHTYHNELGTLIRSRLVQTNVVKRSVGLVVALWAVRKRCRLPVHLIEIGASAGIHLHFDRYRYNIDARVYGQPDAKVVIEPQWRGSGPPPDFDDLPPIASRLGVDLNPVDVTDPAERLWLRALVWPENQQEETQLIAALESVASDPPPMVAGDAIDMCPQLAARLPRGEPRVVFHAATRMHVPSDRRAAFDAAIDALGEDGPLYHAWHEPPSAPHHGVEADARGVIALHGPGDDNPVAVALADGHLDWFAPLPD